MTNNAAVLPDARALYEKLTRKLARVHHTNAGPDVVLRVELTMSEVERLRCAVIATPPASDAAVPAGEVLGPLWRKVQQVHSDAMRHDWSVEDYRAGMAATLGIAAAPKVASDTGAGETVNVAADAILANVRGRRLLKALFREDANTNTAPVGWIDGPIDLETQRECATTWARLALAAAPKMAIGIEASRIERVAQAIYKASGSLIDQNGFIPWADLDGTTDADSYRRMATAAIATLRANDTGAGLREGLEVLFEQAFADGMDAGKTGDESLLAGSAAVYAQSALNLFATPTDATDGATGGGEVQGNAELAQKVAHRIVSEFRPDGWKAKEDELARLLVDTFLDPATTPGGDLLESDIELIEKLAANDYQTRHFANSLAGAAKRLRAAFALKPAGDGGEA